MFLFAYLGALLSGCTSATRRSPADREIANHVRGTRGTYCRAPRDSANRVDVDRLVSQLSNLHANTYCFCIHQFSTDWDDFKLLLPKARAKGIRVWGSVVPPSESPPRLKMYAEPFRLDYVRWSEEFARLSLKEPNLVAWSIDDFTHNLKFFTPEYLKRMRDAARAINPRLAFVPCCYYPGITSAFATNYVPLLDGILFPYRHESHGSNLTNTDLIIPEVARIKEVAGPSCPVIIDFYVSAHSRLGASTPEYVEQAMKLGHSSADGVMIYCHQDPDKNAEKFEIIGRLFTSWSRQETSSRRP